MKRLNWPEISKMVGWNNEKTANYPSIRLIRELFGCVKESNRIALAMLLAYHRFLRSPKTKRERDIIRVMMNIVMHCRDKYCE